MKIYKINDEEFNAILCKILEKQIASQLLSIPGIYEIVSEYFNNDVLEQWEINKHNKDASNRLHPMA